MSLYPLQDPLEDYKIKRFYNWVLSQTFSNTGKYIFAGNSFGDIFVFNIESIQNATEEPPETPQIYPQGDNVEINCLAFHRDCLIIGGIGTIYALKWCEEKAELATNKAWEINIPLDPNAIEVPDVNCLWLHPKTDRLYAGCGDNVIYEFSLEDGNFIRDYNGHDDYIHSICGTSQSRLYSASEDGSVRFWSPQEKEAIHILKPYADEKLARPEMGKWLGAVDTNGDWLICGGGPKLSLWHLNTLQCTSEFPFPERIHVCNFIDDTIFVAGEWTNAQFYTMNVNLRADIKTDNTAIYSAVWQLEPQRFMSIAGFSNELSILKDFHFMDTKIELYTNNKKEK